MLKTEAVKLASTLLFWQMPSPEKQDAMESSVSRAASLEAGQNALNRD